MIEIINSPEQFNEWTKRDIYSIRVLSLLESYGTKYHFATFYRQIIDGKITAILSRLDNDITLALDDGFDNAEFVRFFCITGHGAILCDPAFEFGAKYDEGMIMACNNKHDSVMAGVEIDEYPKLMDLFNFVDYGSQDFKAWYVDISHRVRHNTAKAYTLNFDGNIISSGILSSIYDGYGVLTAVRTADNLRRMGYGGHLVSYICSDVKKSVYIMREMDINEEFYTKLGFENIGVWRMYR